MSVANDCGDSGLWAITSYYNPLSYRSRYTNYQRFHERLGIPLLTVELGYGSEFELNDSDADILMQLRGGDVLWQKERLLNIALNALPPHCTKVAWIDCDVFFADEGWADHACRLLDTHAIVQLFSRGCYLTPDDSAEDTHLSVACAAANGLDASASGRYSPGFAWAARREVLREQGFYDACVIGGGDRAMTCAMYGCFDLLVRRQQMGGRHFEHYIAWAEPFNKAIRGAIGFVQGSLYHLWHGALSHRRWQERHEGWQAFQFDPVEDLALTEQGTWRWNSYKPEMHAYVREHFVLRREDG